jgi:hypothetical protein
MAEGAIGGRACLRILPIAIAGALLVAASDAFDLPVPAGVLPPEVPAENPPTAAKVSLGQKLCFDTRLSTDGTVACVTCHDPRHAFADGRGKRTSAGVRGALGTRNAPTVLNAAFLAAQFWDGRALTLEEQAEPLRGGRDAAPVLLRDMVNWRIENPLEGKPLAADDPRILALEAYILAERAGKAFEAGKH